MDRAAIARRTQGSRGLPADDQLAAAQRGDAGDVIAELAAVVERGDRVAAIVDRRDDGAGRAEVDAESHAARLPGPIGARHFVAEAGSARDQPRSGSPSHATARASVRAFSGTRSRKLALYAGSAILSATARMRVRASTMARMAASCAPVAWSASAWARRPSRSGE